jgi:small conductance mechanosensitive channel
MRPTRLFLHGFLLALLAGALAPVLGSVPVASAQPGVPQSVSDALGGGEGESQPAEGAGEEEPERFLPESPPDSVLTRELLDPGAWARLGEKMVERLIAWLPSLFAALVVLFLFWILQRVLDGVLRRLMGRTRADPAAQEIAGRLMRYVVLGFGVVTAAAQLGFNVGSLLAGLGILGLALGLAAQDSLANLVAGLTILWDRPFRIGDNVTVSGTFGKVQEIGLRTTRIRTVDQLDAMLPNKEIINQKIVNHTLSPMMRLDIPLGIAYKEDSREARKVLLAAVAGNELLLEKPEPEVVVVALADSSVNLELRVWLRDPYKERQATVEMIERAKIALDEAGIEIPFPQRTLHLPSGVRLVRSDDEGDG